MTDLEAVKDLETSLKKLTELYVFMIDNTLGYKGARVKTDIGTKARSLFKKIKKVKCAIEKRIPIKIYEE